MKPKTQNRIFFGLTFVVMCCVCWYLRELILCIQGIK